MVTVTMSRNNNYWYMGMMKHIITDTAKESATDFSKTTASHYYQVCTDIF